MARQSEQQHPFYKPLWRRVAIVAVIFFWLCFEIWTGSSEIWIVLALAMLAYAVYTFFLTWPREQSAGKNIAPKDDGGASP